MLLLVTDTSGRNGSVALARASDGLAPNDVHLIEESPLAGGTFSAQLVPQIAALLTKHGFGKTDIGAYVVVSGPGSFTGLRVGLAAIKALAEILKKPIVPVSPLEVLAIASGVRGRVVSTLDAGRGDLYVGEYDVGDEGAQVVRERLLTKDEGLLLARASTLATPDEALAAAARDAGNSVCLITLPGTETIARVGLGKLRGGVTVTPEELEANYIRRSDAEIFAKPAS
ncbi:MAG TPA: tRNA (adenosine(37)-N6)-threonylcarbamoyltransferase complex dimerization subunit type 1 TsaB [Candidatus Sulfotelmatobacter sp.]|jgi:tRNA threonylcarbamoyladenosine biosynthesis protein TsaB|nr:tRNA (adenosine(37)-N6)-threonylcarbamoyltransferase complex dimerization subunit type 1 TsaB [Candidatus Sulfotelmatobacter sp.]